MKRPFSSLQTRDEGNRTLSKRGLARQAPRASQACQSCATSKVRCDDLQSCRRCVKRRVPCIRSTSFSQDHKSSPENEVNDADSQASGDGIAHEAYDRPQHGTDGEHLVSKNKAKALVSVENIYQDVALTFNPPTLGEEHTMPVSEWSRTVTE